MRPECSGDLACGGLAVGVGVAPVGCPLLTGIGAAEVVGGVVVSGVVVVVALLPDEQPSSTA